MKVICKHCKLELDPLSAPDVRWATVHRNREGFFTYCQGEIEKAHEPQNNLDYFLEKYEQLQP